MVHSFLTADSRTGQVNEMLFHLQSHIVTEDQTLILKADFSFSISGPRYPL